MKMETAKLLFDLLTKAPFSQEQIATYLECDQSLISKWKKQERKISTDQFEKLCGLLSYSMNDFLMGKIYEPTRINFRASALEKDDIQAIGELNKLYANLNFMKEILYGKAE
ncbi:MAG: helix-turn-helix transcriptional regulator [Firmicutes bacterium]|nr:helix-turn-helix transcriptional regulator [Bacillota bacterium]